MPPRIPSLNPFCHDGPVENFMRQRLGLQYARPTAAAPQAPTSAVDWDTFQATEGPSLVSLVAWHKARVAHAVYVTDTAQSAIRWPWWEQKVGVVSVLFSASLMATSYMMLSTLLIVPGVILFAAGAVLMGYSVSFEQQARTRLNEAEAAFLAGQTSLATWQESLGAARQAYADAQARAADVAPVSAASAAAAPGAVPPMPAASGPAHAPTPRGQTCAPAPLSEGTGSDSTSPDTSPDTSTQAGPACRTGVRRRRQRPVARPLARKIEAASMRPRGARPASQTAPVPVFAPTAVLQNWAHDLVPPPQAFGFRWEPGQDRGPAVVGVDADAGARLGAAADAGLDSDVSLVTDSSASTYADSDAGWASWVDIGPDGETRSIDASPR